MNINRFHFSMLTKFLIAPETSDDDKHNITNRIIKDSGITPNRESYHWVRYNTWNGFETDSDILRMYQDTFSNITQLDEANELVKIAYELSDRCELDEIEVDDEWVDVWRLKANFGSYLAEYGLD